MNLKSENEVIDAFKSIKDKLTEIGKGNQMDGVTVQKMVIDGFETIIGVSNDPSFGPLIMFGMGGVNAEVLNDIAFRLNPLTELDAEELIGSVKVSKLLGGFQGTSRRYRRLERFVAQAFCDGRRKSANRRIGFQSGESFTGRGWVLGG